MFCTALQIMWTQSALELSFLFFKLLSVGIRDIFYATCRD